MTARIIAVAVLLALVLGGGIVAYFSVSGQKNYDEKTLCPLTPIPAKTAMLIDATDALSEMQIARLLEIIEELPADLVLHEWIGIFIVDEDNTLLPKPVVSLCNPGDGRDANILYQNPALIKRRFQNQFYAPIRKEVSALLQRPPEASSPIMEMINSVATHAEFRSDTRRLIIVSDMLQNVPAYSQYSTAITGEDYFDEWAATDYAQKIMSSSGVLNNTAVQIYYVRRQDESGGNQTLQHIDFWKRYLSALGGIDIRFEQL